MNKSGEKGLRNNRVSWHPEGAKGQLPLVEWFEGEPFCLGLREASFSQSKQINQERTCYVKLVIDLPDYCASGGPVRIRWNRRDRGVDRPNTICCFPRLVCSLPHHGSAPRGLEDSFISQHGPGRPDHET